MNKLTLRIHLEEEITNLEVVEVKTMGIISRELTRKILISREIIAINKIIEVMIEIMGIIIRIIEVRGLINMGMDLIGSIISKIIMDM